jgi:S1-C subfamily serine protease
VDELVALGGASPIEIPRGIVERVRLAVPKGASVARRHAPAAAELGILVRASVVRAAIARGGRPSGSAVGPSGERPAGLVLSGISAYGSALRDGDILTRVGGTPATSASRVIGAVTGAVRSGAKAIDGEVWRDGRRIPVVVELPRPARPKRAKG